LVVLGYTKAEQWGNDHEGIGILQIRFEKVFGLLESLLRRCFRVQTATHKAFY